MNKRSLLERKAKANRRQATIQILCLVVVLLAGSSETAFAVRGRPVITKSPAGIGTTYATFVSDTGSLLRGPRWSPDINGCSLPTRAQIANLRNFGFNALHVYGESFNEGYPAGTCAAAIDTLVEWTRGADLYLVLTIGNGIANGTYSYGFAEDFWTFYAPRYANNTHVIYEIQNEPYYNTAGQSQPSPSSLITFERDMYNLIRSHAPNTPILLFSYAVFRNGNQVMQDVNALGSTVNWSNAAIAFHGYAGLAETGAALQVVVGNGIPCVQTEFAILDPYQQDVDQTILYEDRFTSWFTFLDLPNAFNNAKYKTLLDQAWVVWAADFGTWPAVSAPPVGSIVALQAQVNGKWVSAVNGGASPLRAQANTVGTAEKYLVVASSDPRFVGLKAQANQKFVTAENAGADFLIANRNALAWWESFQWMTRPDGTVVLKARANLKIVSNDLNLLNPPQLIANRKTGGPWERYLVTIP